MQTHDFTEGDRHGTCTLCGAACWIINGVPMHDDGWRDDACNPSPAEIRAFAKVPWGQAAEAWNARI